MYVDQETAQDEEENMKATVNQSIMEGTDVNLLTIKKNVYAKKTFLH